MPLGKEREALRKEKETLRKEKDGSKILQKRTKYKVQSTSYIHTR